MRDSRGAASAVVSGVLNACRDMLVNPSALQIPASDPAKPCEAAGSAYLGEAFPVAWEASSTTTAVP